MVGWKLNGEWNAWYEIIRKPKGEGAKRKWKISWNK